MRDHEAAIAIAIADLFSTIEIAIEIAIFEKDRDRNFGDRTNALLNSESN